MLKGQGGRPDAWKRDNEIQSNGVRRDAKKSVTIEIRLNGDDCGILKNKLYLKKTGKI